VVARGRGLQSRAGKKRGSKTGPSPVNRARRGSKHHLLVDASGIPLAWTVTGGNRNDVTQLVPLVERVPPVRGKVGRPRRRPERVTADRGYDHDKYRRELRRRGIGSEIARRQADHGSGLGRARWVVERTFAWLHHFKRLLVRYDRRHEIHEAFLAIGCSLVCFRRLRVSLHEDLQ
jgi:transposase